MKSGDQRRLTFGNDEMERLKNRVMVEISVDIRFIKEVGFARDRFRGVAATSFQDVRRGQRFHGAIFSIDNHSIVEHDAVLRHTLNNPDSD